MQSKHVSKAHLGDTCLLWHQTLPRWVLFWVQVQPHMESIEQLWRLCIQYPVLRNHRPMLEDIFTLSSMTQDSCYFCICGWDAWVGTCINHFCTLLPPASDFCIICWATTLLGIHCCKPSRLWIPRGPTIAFVNCRLHKTWLAKSAETLSFVSLVSSLPWIQKTKGHCKPLPEAIHVSRWIASPISTQ